MEAAPFYFAHLISKADPNKKVLETVKLNRGMMSAQNVKDQVAAYLSTQRDDGNKIYAVQSVHTFDLETEALVLENTEDIFVVVDVQIDTSRHVKPLAMRDVTTDVLKFKTLTKYTYFESGKNYIKVQLSELAGLTKEVLEVDFQNRSLSVRVFNFNGSNYQFTVPKLQCKILPKDCQWTIKQNCLQLTLRKKKEEDNWYSLFKTMAIGERPSDDSN